MSTVRDLELYLSDTALKTKDDNGTIKVFNTFYMVNTTENVINDCKSFASIRARFNDLYGSIASKIIDTNEYSDNDIVRMFGKEKHEGGKLVKSGDVLVDRTNGKTIARAIVIDGNIRFFECNKNKEIKFKAKTFTSFFYTFADDKKHGWFTRNRLERMQTLSNNDKKDHNLTLGIRPINGALSVSVKS